MLPSPAEGGPDRRGAAGHSADHGFMAAPLAEAFGVEGSLAEASVSAGGCFARPLPLRRERRTTNLEFVSSMATITRLARATDLAMQNVYWDFRKRLCRYSGLPSNVDSARLAASRRSAGSTRPAAASSRAKPSSSGRPPMSTKSTGKPCSRISDVTRS